MDHYDLQEASHSRAFGIEPREEKAGDENVRLLTFTAASDEPYTRALWAGNVREVTDFEGLDETRLRGGKMPLLDSHRNEKLEDILGKIVGYRKLSRGDGNVLEVTAEFRMDDPHSRAAYEKVKSGLVNNVSIGYSPKYPDGMETKWYKVSDIDNDIAADVRLVDWEVLEVSLVPVPADNSIGIGRAGDRELSKAYKDALAASKIPTKSMTPRRPDMTDTTKPEAEAKADEVAATKAADARSDEAVSALERRLSDIEQKEKAAEAEAKEAPVAEAKEAVVARKDGTDYIAKNAFSLTKAGADQEFVTKLAKEAGEGEGLSEAQVKAMLWTHIQEKDSDMSNIGQGQAPAIRASKDARHNFFDFQKVAVQLAKGVDALDGREAEVIQQHKSDTAHLNGPGMLSKEHSVMIPFSAYGEDPAMRRQVERLGAGGAKRFEVGATAAGFNTDVFDEGWFTDRLTNKATVLPYINFLPVEQKQDLVGVTASGNYAAGFVNGETATRGETTGLTFGNRKLEWRLAYGRADFTQQALEQSTFLFGTALAKLSEDVTRRIDQEVVLGTSHAAGGFRGLINYDAVHDISGANGAVLGYSSLTDMIEYVEAGNADVRNAKFILTPKTKGWLRAIQRQAGATGGQADVIISSQAGEMPQIDGYDVITSNWPGLKAQPKGTNNTNIHEWSIFGDLSDITGCYFTGTELVVDNYTGLEQGITKVYIRLALDVQPDHVASFVVGTFRRS